MIYKKSSKDLGDYFRIPSDTRDLNYTKYFEQGETSITRGNDYTSENTRRLDVDGMVKLLMGLRYIQELLATGQAREVD